MLRIRLHMPEHVYAAALAPGSRAVPEWPPAPWRLASALVAGASTLGEQQRRSAWTALERVEHAEPPVWHLPSASASPRITKWAAMTQPETPHRPGKLVKVLELSAALPGVSDLRTKYRHYSVRIVTAEPAAWMDVDVDLPEDEMTALGAAALAVPYVGQSTHPGELGVLSPVDAGGWVDHTSPDGTCPAELAEPGAQHERWTPSKARHAVAVRCWRPGMLAVLEEDHARRTQNQPGVPEYVKGRMVGYAPTFRRSPSAWRPVGLRRPTHDVTGTLGPLPVEEGSVLPILRRERLVGLVCDSAATLLRLQQTIPDALATDDRVRRTTGRFLAAAYRWRSATPVIAHPDVRIARAQIEQELTEFGPLSECVLAPLPTAPQPVRGLTTWQVDVAFTESVRGPLRVGDGGRFGAGMFMANDMAKDD